MGPCNGHNSVFSWLPNKACRPAPCLISEAANSPIDISIFPLRIWQPSELELLCEEYSVASTKDSELEVSFLLTVHNNEFMTRQCIIELFRTSWATKSIEFIVIDDGSEKELVDLKSDLQALKDFFGVPYSYVRNEKPVGYGEANNMGAALARGKYIALINNDMFPTPGWLDTLLHTLKTYPNAGLAGPLFVGKGNLIQEAGAFLANDGGAYLIGRGSRLGSNNYSARPVDYISAACNVLERSLFLELGGFDKIYGKGYYEDTDLAMKIRASGRYNVFQPYAVVFHQEGGTFGDAAVKAELLHKNREIFLERWKAQLQGHCPHFNDMFKAMYRLRQPNVLIIDRYWPSRNLGSLRMMHIIEALMVLNYNLGFQTLYQAPLQYKAQLAVSGVMTYAPNENPEHWELVHASGCIWKVVILSAKLPDVGTTLQAIRDKCPAAKIILDIANMAFLEEAQAKGGLDLERTLEWIDTNDSEDAEAAKKIRDRELAIVDAADATIVTTSIELGLLKLLRPEDKPFLVSNMFKLPHKGPSDWSEEECSKRNGVLFIATNFDSSTANTINTLVNDILPSVADILNPHMPLPVLHVVVSTETAPHFLDNADFSKIVYHQSLSDAELARVYDQVRVFIAPLRGAEERQKISKALFDGLPVVVLPSIAEIMSLEQGRHCLVANGLEGFGEQILRAFKDCKLCNRLRKNGFSAVKRLFNFEDGKRNITKLFTSLGVPPLDKKHAFDPPCEQT